MAGVSIRKSIRWLPDDASEPTSTIVLSSAQRRFVDIRILKPENEESDIETDQHLDLTRLDWAIAGTSSSVDQGAGVTLSTFHHWIDSRTLDVDAATDEGYMSPLPSDGGGDDLVLEKGRMVNPATGAPTDYEEVWIERALRAVPGDGGSQVVVLDLDRGVDHRGRVVRVGTCCQGVVRRGEQVAAERWEWVEGEGWVRRVLVGSEGVVPCGKLLEEEEADGIEWGGEMWRVVERS